MASSLTAKALALAASVESGGGSSLGTKHSKASTRNRRGTPLQTSLRATTQVTKETSKKRIRRRKRVKERDMLRSQRAEQQALQLDDVLYEEDPEANLQANLRIMTRDAVGKDVIDKLARYHNAKRVPGKPDQALLDKLSARKDEEEGGVLGSLSQAEIDEVMAQFKT
eukprot:m.103944 g.103944  ORF g.103944 m.103944 type:complete len:168 (-) comp15607_c0_seq1:70-573(-)